MRSIPTQQNTTGTRDGLCRSRGILRPFQRGPMAEAKNRAGKAEGTMDREESDRRRAAEALLPPAGHCPSTLSLPVCATV